MQIISNHNGKYKLIKTIGCSKNPNEVLRLLELGKIEIDKINKQANFQWNNSQN